jgi:hypothetical protein
MSTKLRAIQGLAIGLFFLVSLVVPIHGRAASPALDEQIIADAYVYLIVRALVVRQEHLDVAAQGGLCHQIAGASHSTPGIDIFLPGLHTYRDL